MKPKWIVVLIITILLGAGIPVHSVYSEELTAGDEYGIFIEDEMYYEILESGDAEGNPETEPIVPKPSDSEDTIIDGIEDGGAYVLPLTVKVIGANSFDEETPVNGDTRWHFYSWSVDEGEIHTDYTDSEDELISEFIIPGSEEIKTGEACTLHIDLQQQMLMNGVWIPAEGVETVRMSMSVEFSMPSGKPEYWVGSDGPFLRIQEGSIFDTNVVIPENRELTFAVQDESIVSVEGTEMNETEEGGEYVTKVSLKGLKAGDTVVRVYDGDAVIWTYEITVTQSPARDPYIANIDDTTVEGITDLILKPSTFYVFTVTGAGTDNADPITGDTRWVPLYWREESGTALHTNWRFGVTEGINEFRTIPIRIYLQEQQYDEKDGGWEATGTVDFITADVTTSAYFDPYQIHQPVLIAAYNGAKGIGIKFYKENAAIKYLIYRKFNGQWSYICTVRAEDPNLQISGDTIMYTDTTVAQNYGKGYIYSVAAANEESVTTYDTKGAAIYRLTPPALTKVTNTDSGTAVVTWKGVFGSTETNGAYDLQYTEYKDGKAGEFQSVITRPGYNHQTLSATVTGLKKGSRYVFRIRCSKTNKDRGTYYSEYSKWLSVTIEK